MLELVSRIRKQIKIKLTMKALVTGATGDIGSRLTSALLAKGYEIRALVRQTSKVEKLISADVELHYGDITKPETLKGIADGVDLIFHLCGALWVRNPAVDLKIHNFDGTRHLAKECLGKNVRRFVFASFPLVVGPHTSPLDETAPCHPNAYHAKYKRMAEEYLLNLDAKGLLPVTVLRLGQVYGPGMKLVKMYVPLLRKRIYRLMGSGVNLIHPVHVDDVIQGMILAAEKDCAVGQIYNICDDLPVTNREFMHLLADAIGAKRPSSAHLFLFRIVASICTAWAIITRGTPFLTNDIITMAITSYCSDTSKAKKELGFSPKYPTIYQGIRTCF
jgi:dihydroflavonol-4-reductase